MEDFVKKVLAGEVTDEELNAFKGKLSEEAKKQLDESLAFRDKRRDEEKKFNDTTTLSKAEEERLAGLRKDADAEEERLKGTRSANSQYREEQLGKAKTKFFETYNIPADKQVAYEEEFKKQDSGKIDPELIIKDFEKAHVVLNSDAYLETERKQREMERNAEGYNAGAAGGHSAGPQGQQKPKFSEATQKLAEESGISVEAADKIEKEGMTRMID